MRVPPFDEAAAGLLSTTRDLREVYVQLAETEKAIIERRTAVLADQMARGASVAAAEREVEIATGDLRVTREENIRDVKILTAERDAFVTLLSSRALE